MRPTTPARALLHAGLGGALLYADDLPGAAGHLDAATARPGEASLPMAHLLEAPAARGALAYRAGRLGPGRRRAASG